MNAQVNSKVEAALAKWIDGEEIGREVGGHGTVVAVTRNEDGYSVFRAFPIGDGTGVSVDLADATTDDLIRHLLARYAL
jgi:hypothetical protein